MEEKYRRLREHRPDLWIRTANGVYYMGVHRDKLRSLRTTDLEQALLLYDANYGKPVPVNGKRVRCSEAFAAFAVANHVRADVTVVKHKGEWNNWAEDILGPMHVAEVEPSDIIRVLTRARTEPCRTGEPRKDVYNLESAMKVFFNWCMAHPRRYRVDNPVTLLDKSDKAKNPSSRTRKVQRNRVFRPEEIDAIAAHMDANPGKYGTSRYGDKAVNIYKHQTIARVGAEIGARIAELLAGQLDDIQTVGEFKVLSIVRQLNTAEGDTPRGIAPFDPEDASTWFKPLKGEKGVIGDEQRDVVLSGYAEEVLEEYVGRGLEEGWLVEGGLLYPNFKFRPLVPGHVGRWLSDAAGRAGLRKFTSHDFRHTYVSQALEAGASIEDIAMVTGHSDAMIRRVYGHWENREAHFERMRAIGRQRSGDDNVVDLASHRAEASRHHDRVAR